MVHIYLSICKSSMLNEITLTLSESDQIIIKEGGVPMQKKRELAIVLMLCLFFDTFVWVPVFASQHPLQKVQVGNAFSLCVNKQKKIKIKNMPEGAKVSFAIKKAKIATVTKNGIVKAKKKGKATIVIVISHKNNKIIKKCKVTVVKKKTENDNKNTTSNQKTNETTKNSATETDVLNTKSPNSSASATPVVPSQDNLQKVSPFPDGTSIQAEVPNTTETPNTAELTNSSGTTDVRDTIGVPDASETLAQTENPVVSETPSGNQNIMQTENPGKEENQLSPGEGDTVQDNTIQTEPEHDSVSTPEVEIKKEDTMYFTDDVTHGGLYVGEELYLISKENIKKILNHKIKEFSTRTLNLKTLDMGTVKALLNSENKVVFDTTTEEKIVVTITNKTSEDPLSLYAQSETIPIRFVAYNVLLTEAKEESTFYIGADYYKVTYNNLVDIDNRVTKILEYEKNGVKQQATAQSGTVELDGYTFYLDYDKNSKKMSLMIIDSQLF